MEIVKIKEGKRLLITTANTLIKISGPRIHTSYYYQ